MLPRSPSPPPPPPLSGWMGSFLLLELDRFIWRALFAPVDRRGSTDRTTTTPTTTPTTPSHPSGVSWKTGSRELTEKIETCEKIIFSVIAVVCEYHHAKEKIGKRRKFDTRSRCVGLGLFHCNVFCANTVTRSILIH